MSVVVRFWIFTALTLGAYLFLVWKATTDPKFLVFTFFVLLLFAAGTRQFRCPQCRNPIMKRPTTENRLGYMWRVPTSMTCTNCGARL